MPNVLPRKKKFKNIYRSQEIAVFILLLADNDILR